MDLVPVVIPWEESATVIYLWLEWEDKHRIAVARWGKDDPNFVVVEKGTSFCDIC